MKFKKIKIKSKTGFGNVTCQVQKIVEERLSSVLQILQHFSVGKNEEWPGWGPWDICFYTYAKYHNEHYLSFKERIILDYSEITKNILRGINANWNGQSVSLWAISTLYTLCNPVENIHRPDATG